MRLVALLLAIAIPCCVHAEDLEALRKAREARKAEVEARRERGRELAAERQRQKQLAKELARFREQFIIRQRVPIRSGVYVIGWRVVETPNYEAIQAYQRQLAQQRWDAMTPQQKRDAALMTIASSSRAMSAAAGQMANSMDSMSTSLQSIQLDVSRMADQADRRAISQFIDDTWSVRLDR
ncbi:hypothetical protein [Roseiconus lacunae]|uniref:Uncharacterized protein n=1 Tax=Roseiconus lacunae TaxID=2605694 RepID=A0ABT7PNA9_9BACT|nr:hypothetical protein [Roseiconus lacunae]MDM4017771.1 hypothetical protein [Roseiconus lacunae]